MKKILIITENRRQMRNLCAYLEGAGEFELALAYYSTNAFAAFLRVKPQVVILDSGVIVPFSMVLEQMQQCSWDYRVIVLGQANLYRAPKMNNVFYWERRENFDGILELLRGANPGNLAREDTTGEAALADMVSLKPDFYSLMLCRFLGPADTALPADFLLRLRRQADTIGPFYAVCADGNDLLLIMAKSKMKSPASFVKLHEMLRGITHLRYAAFFSEEVGWNQADAVFYALLRGAERAYFLENESVNLQSFPGSPQTPPFGEINERLSRLLEGALRHNQGAVAASLKALYFTNLKSAMDCDLLQYVRGHLVLLNGLLSAALDKPYEKISLEYAALEDEFRGVLAHFSHLCTLFQAKAVPPIAVDAILFIFQNYQSDLSPGLLAEKLAISKAYLGRLLKKEIGLTFLELLQTMRMNIVKYDLGFTRYKISKIAADVGYQDAHYFSRLFKKRVGISPEEYRLHVRAIQGEGSARRRNTFTRLA